MKSMVTRLFCLAIVAALSFGAFGAGLPTGYTQLKYIETSAGGPYVNTGYEPISTTDIELKGYMPIGTTESNRNRVFYWTRAASPYPSFAFIINSAKEIRVYRMTQGGGGTQLTLTEAIDSDVEFWLFVHDCGYSFAA